MTDFDWRSWPGFALAVAIALVAVVLVVAVLWLVVRLVARLRPEIAEGISRPRRRLRVMLALAALQVAVQVAWPHPPSLGAVRQALLIASIAAAAWLLTAVIALFVVRALSRFRIDVADNRVARRVHTQVNILKRLGMVVVWVLAVGAILLTFPGAQAAGASVLASAGLVSVVAGLAAQSTLSNVFAGMQLAFSGAIRVDDVVIAEGEWGRIEEITLTYVVVRIWDDRRLVLPSTHFTTTPFQNWTRHSSDLLGSVELDLDWRVSPAQMREELDRILDGQPLWNGKVKVLQVTDAVGGFVRIRVLVSADDAGRLFDLRCIVRERMVEWMHTVDPGALPRQRVVVGEQEPRVRTASKGRRTAPSPESKDEGLFSGSPEAEARNLEFTGAIGVQEDAGPR